MPFLGAVRTFWGSGGGFGGFSCLRVDGLETIPLRFFLVIGRGDLGKMCLVGEKCTLVV